MVHKNTALLTFNTSKHCVLQAEGESIWHYTTVPWHGWMKNENYWPNFQWRKVDYQTDKFFYWLSGARSTYHQLFMIVVLKNAQLFVLSHLPYAVT